MVNLKALEKSLAKIGAVGQDELSFEFGDTSVVLRPLSPEEENEVERYARSAYNADEYIPSDPLEPTPKELADTAVRKAIGAEDGDPSNEEQTESIIRNRMWIDRLRQASLSYSIIEIDGQDLRTVEYIETGEYDSQGNPVSVPKYDALFEVIIQWGRPVLTQMFSAYGELVDRVNLRASKMVKFDPADVEEEEKRLKSRLADLERRKKESQPTSEIPTALGVAQQVNQSQRETTQTVSQQMHQERERLQQKASEASPDPAVEAAAEEIQRRREMRQGPPREDLPEGMPPVDEPPVSRTPRTPLSMRQPQAEESPQEPPQEPQDPNKVSDPHGGDSFFDPADGDAAYIAEMQRQEEIYRRQQEREKQQKEARAAAEAQGKRPLIQGRAKKPGPSGATADNRAGLRNALNTSNAVYDGGAGQVQRSQPAARPSGKKGDVPIYKMPTTTLERRGQKVDPSQIQVDPASSSRNPRFVGPRDNND